MMPYPLTQRSFVFEHATINLLVPDAGAVQASFLSKTETGESPLFPFWTRVWPAAIGLATFLDHHNNWITKKTVLELAAGLGLPSLVAAHWATNVTCSDIAPEAAAVVERSIAANGLQHCHTQTIDMTNLAGIPLPEVVLISDINYDPAFFEQLYGVIGFLIAEKCTVILSTPHRLMAKPFIEKLLSWCVFTQSTVVEKSGTKTEVSIYVLRS